MSRNKYDDAKGVARIRWTLGGDLDKYGMRLVEVWRSSLDLSREADKPRMRVTAEVQVWVWMKRVNVLGGTDGSYGWHRVSSGGDVSAVDLDATKIRRWARMPTRNWYGTVALDGWSKE